MLKINVTWICYVFISYKVDCVTINCSGEDAKLALPETGLAIIPGYALSFPLSI